MRRVWWMLWCLGCGGASTEAECIANHTLIPASACPSEAGLSADDARDDAVEKSASSSEGPEMSAFEQGLLTPMLEDIRAGVQPFAAETVGICEGTGKTCDAFLGLDPGELPPGEFMLRGEFRAPKIGDKGTWKVSLQTECVTTQKTANGENSKTDRRERAYDVVYAGEDRGYRLSPMVKIDSPSKSGDVACTYTLTTQHPDAPTTLSGGWKVAAAD
jgi:hypothetical protein